MALVLADRVKETTTTTGTGTVTLAGAVTGYQTFAAVGNANTTYYTIASQTSSDWEVGIGTYTSSGTTLSRTTVISSSNGGSLVNFSAGTKDVFVTYPAGRSVYADGAVLTATNSAILPVTSGGTGVTTSTGSGDNVLSNSPNLTAPALGTPISGTVTNLTGTASININGTVGATTANTGSFTTLAATGNTSLATTAVLYDGNGAVSSGRLLGRYSYRNATPATAYFYDFNNTNTISSADSVIVSRIPNTLNNSNLTNANALTAFGTNYGTKAAGLSFVSGTSSDVTLVAVGSTPLLNADINAVVVGYTAVGPRIAIQNYALNDDTADAISYVGAVHRFYPTSTAVVTIASTGLTVVTTTGGLGYGTGSGGTVTQGTSRTTGVTLSKSNGAINMFSDVGSAIAATFTVTNTLVAATDTIILNQKSGTNLYVLLVTAVAAGSFNITFYTTGGVATDAPVINFSLIKAVTA